MSAPVELATWSRRGRPRDGRIDEQIISAAVDVLADDGFDLFSVEAVAHRAGVAKTTVYRRFPCRADLIEGALQDLGDEEPAVTPTGTVRERLTVYLAGVRSSTPGSRRGRILMHAMSSGDPHVVQRVYDQVLGARRAAVIRLIEDGIAAGEFRPDLDVDAAMAVLIGPMIYLGIWRSVDSVERVSVDAVVDLLAKGLTPASDS